MSISPHMNIFDRLQRKKKPVGLGPLPFGRNPRRDWRFVIGGFLVVSVCFIALASVLYVRVSRGEIFLSDKETAITPQTIDRERLRKAVEFFEAKRQKFETARRNPLRLPDPSR